MTKYNLLWIFVDEQRGQALECAGDPNLKTPNIDRLGQEGVYCPRAYSNSPMCTPARGIVHTGRYCTSNGALSNHYPLLPSDKQQMAEIMEANGYNTCHYGKWHLSGGTVAQHFVSPFFRPGWQEWQGWECMHGLAGSGTYYDTTYGAGHSNIRIKKIPGFQTDWLADRSVEWIESQSQNKPWFQCVSIETPHAPYDAPRNVSAKHYKRFADADITLRDNVPAHLEEKATADHKGYYSHIENIDEAVGRMLTTLEETGQLERTIICYFADHGSMLGSNDMWAKGYAHEESSCIPWLIRLPEVLRTDTRIENHVSRQLISLVDLVPTSLGLCGIDVPDYCEGTDYSAVMRGEVPEVDKPVFMQFEDRYLAHRSLDYYWRAIRDDRWVYTVDLEQGPRELFDLEADPYQMNNLVHDEGHADVRQMLHDQLVQKADSIGDDFFSRTEWLKVAPDNAVATVA